MGKQIINGDVEITGQLLKGDLKALYHLGAYDSVDTSNADYDVVTRNGYYFDENSKWTYYADPNVYVISIAGVSSDTSNVVCNKSFAYRYSWDGTDSHWYFENGKYYLIVIPSDLQGIVIQAKNPSSYTEKVLKNQPLSTLDQNGENWLRGMYEKTLNLLQENIRQSDVWSIYLGNAYLENGKTYYLWIDKAINGSRLAFKGEFYFTGYEFYKYGSFTYTGTTGFGELVLQGTYDSSSMGVTKAMLNEGTHALPYQPYNGKVMHAIDVEGVKLWENGNPSSTQGTLTVTLADNLSHYREIKIGYRYYCSNSCDSYEYFKPNMTYIILSKTYLDASEIASRHLVIQSDTSIAFGNGYCWSSVPSGSSSVNSAFCVITAIYGIK